MQAPLSVRLWRALQRKPPLHPVYRYSKGGFLSQQRGVMDPAVMWTYIVGRALSQERERGRYDTLATTTLGPMGVNWIIASVTMHRHDMMVVQMLHIGSWYARAIVLLVSLAWFSWFIGILGGMLLMQQVDIVLGALLGMLAPTLTVERANAAVFAVMVHVLLFIGVLLAGLVPAAVVYRVLGWPVLVAAAVALLMMALAGHVVIVGLWRLLVHRLGAGADDVRFVLGD